MNICDQDRVFTWRNLSEVRRWMYTSHLITSCEHDAWFRGVLADADRHYWIIEQNGTPVGVINLAPRPDVDDVFSFGIYIGETKARGSGAAFAALFLALDYAFSNLGAKAVEAEALADNQDAIRLYIRFGLNVVGSVDVRQGQLRATRLAIDMTTWTFRKADLLEQLQKKGLI